MRAALVLIMICVALSSFGGGQAFLDLYREIKIEYGPPEWGFVDLRDEDCIIVFFWSWGLRMTLRGDRFSDCWRIIDVLKTVCL